MGLARKSTSDKSWDVTEFTKDAISGDGLNGSKVRDVRIAMGEDGADIGIDLREPNGFESGDLAREREAAVSAEQIEVSEAHD